MFQARFAGMGGLLVIALYSAAKSGTFCEVPHVIEL
jgi:hypothetical protein